MPERDEFMDRPSVTDADNVLGTIPPSLGINQTTPPQYWFGRKRNGTDEQRIVVPRNPNGYADGVTWEASFDAEENWFKSTYRSITYSHWLGDEAPRGSKLWFRVDGTKRTLSKSALWHYYYRRGSKDKVKEFKDHHGVTRRRAGGPPLDD